MRSIWSALKFATPTARAGLHRFDKAFGEHSHVDEGQRIMDIVEIDCREAQARERTVKRAHQAARRGSAWKGKEFRCYHRVGGTGAQAVTHDALREIDLSRVDHAGAGIMNGPVRFQYGLT